MHALHGRRTVHKERGDATTTMHALHGRRLVHKERGDATTIYHTTTMHINVHAAWWEDSTSGMKRARCCQAYTA
jgi:hypothetical protein